MRAIGQPVLHPSADLALRAWATSDVSVVREAFADPDIQHWHMRRLQTEDEAHTWIERWFARWVAETDSSWAITSGVSGEPVGQVALRAVDLEFGHGQITYWVLPDSRGRGVATLATAAVSRWALDVLGLHRLEIQHSTANVASCRVAEKAGFALEGTMRSALRHTDGWHDMHTHALISPSDTPHAP